MYLCIRDFMTWVWDWVNERRGRTGAQVGRMCAQMDMWVRVRDMYTRMGKLMEARGVPDGGRACRADWNK